MEPPTPADWKNEPPALFLSAFFQGAYLTGGKRRAARLSYCSSLAALLGPRCGSLRYRSLRFCLPGEHKHTLQEGRRGGDKPSTRPPLRKLHFLSENGINTSVKSHNGGCNGDYTHGQFLPCRGAASGANSALISAGWSITRGLDSNNLVITEWIVL